jgi:aryl-alcohol dehydrogenase-like predicted oxidoreductase
MTSSTASKSGTFDIGGDLTVNRLGYGTMQLTGEGVWGDPDDRDECLSVLRRAVELGVNFIDTADSYGPEVAERLIYEALHPYPEDLVIATKAGLTRAGPGDWRPVGRPRVPAPAVRAEPAAPRPRRDPALPAAPDRLRGAAGRSGR